jgi:malate dehydrogenase (oxaloacetate-decarboxylating)(NADP+)
MASHTLPEVTSKLRGIEVLHDSANNKSTAYTEAERQALGLVGLVPDVTESEDLQFRRVLQQLGHKATDLDRYIYLVGLLDNNETLFYRVVMSDPARFLPVVYDPTIGEACLKYGHIYRRPRGMYLSITRKGHVKDVLRNWPVEDVRVICVTDGGRILGLGDLGANGMPIPIGKLQLYTATAGVPPGPLLPMYLDAGTNNETLLQDPFYLGLRRPRPSTAELYAFVDEFVAAVQEVFPRCCIHFEDWTGIDAVNLLARYRDTVCCYNDDIQGTASVTLAGLLNAVKVTGGKLKDQRFLFVGAGSAGTGIANLIAAAMVQEGASLNDARQRIWMFDDKGLIVAGRSGLPEHLQPYAHPNPQGVDVHAAADESQQIVSAIESLKPTTIVGTSTIGGLFTRQVIEAMSRINDRPGIFALSNPTDHVECVPEDVYRWSKGKALYAAGVQFAPVHLNGKTFLPSQANNLYIFPAVGLAIYATQAKRVTDEMFIEAAHAVADQVTPEQLKQGMLYPPQSNILEAEVRTAGRVAALVFERDLARVKRPKDIDSWLRAMLYKAEYPAQSSK